MNFKIHCEIFVQLLDNIFGGLGKNNDFRNNRNRNIQVKY